MKKITLLSAFFAVFAMNAQVQDLFTADFSSGDFTEFDQVINSASTENFDVITIGSHDTAASANYDPALVPQDERLITQSLDLTNAVSAEVEFNWFASYYWSIDPNDNYDLNVLISIDGGTTYTAIWNETMGQQFSSSDENYLWLEDRTVPQLLEVVDLAAYLGESDVKIAFQYTGLDGAQGAFDDITVRADITLGIDEFTSNNFRHFYNNDTNVLTLKSSNSPLNNVQIYNVLGQEVLNKALSQSTETLNMSDLQDGLYIVKTEIEGQSESFKLLKQ